jgi:hypothetical protein
MSVLPTERRLRSTRVGLGPHLRARLLGAALVASVGVLAFALAVTVLWTTTA